MGFFVPVYVAWPNYVVKYSHMLHDILVNNKLRIYDGGPIRL